MDLKKVKKLLAHVGSNFNSRKNEPIQNFLKQEKSKALNKNDESKAKEIWCLENILSTQNHYIDAYLECKKGEFYKGWCQLELAENGIQFIRKHVDFSNNNYCLEMMDYHIPKFQSLFPYKVFFSPEFVGRARCSVCNTLITPRNKCSHKKGDIYKGQMCFSNMEELKFLGISMVENPVQKYSVAFIDGKDHHNYALPEYYIINTKSPFDAWGYSQTTKLYPHSEFEKVSKEGECPCNSKKLYNECCLSKPGVLMPHMMFHFSEVADGSTQESKLILS